MSVKKVKLHLEASIDLENDNMEMSIEWDSSLEYAVGVLCVAAERHPQIYEAIIASAKALQMQAPKSESRRLAELMMSTLEALDPNEVSEEEQKQLADKLMAMKSMRPQGDA